MKRVLLDTNVYSELLLDKGTLSLLLELIPSAIIIYGSEVTRAELRAVSRKELLEQRSKRVLLLNLYDLVTQQDKRTYRTTLSVEALAMQYSDEYKRSGGKFGFEELRKDFVIVATASLHGVDIVVSKDAKTMLSSQAVRAYRIVNEKNQLRTPVFHDYEDFRALIRSEEVREGESCE